MSTAVHPMLSKVIEATSDWSVGRDTHYDGWRVRHGCVLFGELHKTEVCAKKVMRRDRARAAVQALMEPTQDMIEAAHYAEVPNHTTPLEDERLYFQAALRPLVEGDGE